MTGKTMATIGAAATLGLVGVGAGAATAAGYNPPVPGWGNRVDCPYSTTTTPLRIHAQDGTARTPGLERRSMHRTGPARMAPGGRTLTKAGEG